MQHYEEYVRAAVKAGTDFLVCGAGLPVDLPKIVANAMEEMDQSVEAPALAPVVSTEKSARVIFRYWEKKHHCAPDFVIIEGPLAGGHLGFATILGRSTGRPAPHTRKSVPALTAALTYSS